MLLRRLLSLVLPACLCLPVLAGAADFVQPSTVNPGTELSRFTTVGGRNARLAFHRGYLYVMPQNSGFNATMWDLSNPSAPFRVRDLGRRLNGSHTYGKVGNILIPTGTEALRADTASNPTLFSFYGQYEANSFFYPYRYTCASGYGTPAATQSISDVRTSTNLATMNYSAQTGIAAGKALVMGNILIWAAFHSNAGVAAYDVSNPASPQLLDVLGGVGGYEPTIYGKYVVLAHGSASEQAGSAKGVTFIDYSDPRDLKVTARIADATVPGDHRYIQSQDEYLFVGSAKIDTRTFTVAQTFGGTEDNDFLLPLGNMVAIGSRTQTPVRIFVHQRAPDTRGPWVSYHLPADGAVNQARTSRIGLHVPEHLETSSIVNGDTALVRPVGGAASSAIDGIWTHSSENILTFTPAAQLATNTTYEVVLRAGGVRDVAGNAVASAISFRFSTGATVIGTPPPEPVAQQAFGNGGQPWPIADGERLPVEHFDDGGRNVAWFDTTTGNEGGGTTRPGTDVDIAGSGDTDNNDGGTGMNLGWLAGGDWTEYTCTINGGRYTIDARVASGIAAPGDLQLAVDGTVVGTFPVAGTGGWNTFATLSLANIDLPAGQHVLRLTVIGDGGFNLNWLGFRSQDNRAPTGAALAIAGFPALVDTAVTLTASASDPDGDSLQFRIDPGDGAGYGAWGAASRSHAYAAAGHFRAVMQVRDGRGGTATATALVTVLPRAPSARAPVQSGPITGNSGLGRVWNVNPDSDTLSCSDAGTLAKLWEVAVGDDPRSVALASEGRLWVACRGTDRVEVRRAGDGALLHTLELPYGSAPVGVLADTVAGFAYVTCSGSGMLRRYAVADYALSTLALGPTPQALALAPAGNRLFVTRFISAGETGTVWEVIPASFTLRRTIVLAHDLSPDGGSNSRGVPNYLHSIATSPVADEARIGAKKDNIRRGPVRDGLDAEPDQTVRCIVAGLRYGLAEDDVGLRADLDNREQAAAVLYSPNGDYLFAALQGNNEIAVLDAFSGDVVTRYPTGSAPQGLWLDAGRNRLYCQDFLGRTVSVYDVAGLLGGGDPQVQRLSSIAVVAQEGLSAAVLTGKRIFYHAADTRMSSEGYLSCASCHIDGGHDGRTWDFTNRGEGLRNSIDLRGRRGLGHGRVHWSANFDEIQDFEHDMRGPFGGTGFMSDADFNNGTRNTPLGDAKAGRSAALDALAAYVTSLDRVPRSPHRNANGTMTAAALAGKAIFTRLDCASCHGGADFTDSALGVLHDVGTIRPTSGKRLGQSLTGIDTPTLKGLWDTAPYLHDGSAADLAAVVTGGGDRHGAMAGLDATERAQLIAFLQQLDESADAVVPATVRRRIDISLVGAGTEWAWWLQPLEGRPGAAGPAMPFPDLTRVREHRLGLQGLGDG